MYTCCTVNKVSLLAVSSTFSGRIPYYILIQERITFKPSYPVSQDLALQATLARICANALLFP